MRRVPIFGIDTRSEGEAGSPPQVRTTAAASTNPNLQGRRRPRTARGVKRVACGPQGGCQAYHTSQHGIGQLGMDGGWARMNANTACMFGWHSISHDTNA